MIHFLELLLIMYDCGMLNYMNEMTLPLAGMLLEIVKAALNPFMHSIREWMKNTKERNIKEKKEKQRKLYIKVLIKIKV